MYHDKSLWRIYVVNNTSVQETHICPWKEYIKFITVILRIFKIVDKKGDFYIGMEANEGYDHVWQIACIQ